MGGEVSPRQNWTPASLMSNTADYKFRLPPPLNRTYRAVFSSRLHRTVFFMDYPAKKWKVDAKREIQKNPIFFEGKVFMKVNWFLKRDRDIDSGLKLLIDAFEDICFKDDIHIVKLEVNKSRVETDGFVTVSLQNA